MGFNRIEAKFRAKSSIRQAEQSPYRVSLVYLLLTTLVSQVVGWLISAPMDTLLYYLEWGYGVEDILNYLWATLSGQVVLYAAISILLSVYSTIMSFGYCSYSLRLSRNEEPTLSCIFDGFFKWARVLWMNILQGVFSGLWACAFILPAFLLLVVGMLLEWDVYALMSVYILLFVAGAIMAAVAMYRYSMAAYFLLDDPNRTARECISLSKNAMKGWKMELFTLHMSFIGWTLLGGVIGAALAAIWAPLQIVGVIAFNTWLLPYRATTEANFYNCVVGWKNPIQPTDENDWESRMRDLRDAFGER